MKKNGKKRSFHVIDAILIVVFLAVVSFGIGLALRTVHKDSADLICTVEINDVKEAFAGSLRAGSVLRDPTNTFVLGTVTTVNTPALQPDGLHDLVVTISLHATLTNGTYHINGLPIAVGTELNFRSDEVAFIDAGATVTKISVAGGK